MRRATLGAVAALSLLASTSPLLAQDLTIYSGRGEALVGPIIAQFERDTGLDVEVRYGGTAELATLLQEKGAQSPADVFWAQDSGSLGALAPLFAPLPAEVGEKVAEPYRNPGNQWVATSGRSRVLIYSTERVIDANLPGTIANLTGEKFRGLVAWAPINAGFRAFGTAFRVAQGADAPEPWLEAIKAKDAKVYGNNGTQLDGLAKGEVDLALVNNYCLGRYIAAMPSSPRRRLHSSKATSATCCWLSESPSWLLATTRIRLGRSLTTCSRHRRSSITSEGNEYPVHAGDHRQRRA